jgi:nucleoredoxin
MCQFEIILISGDDTESEFKDNYSSMPWLALPFGDIRAAQLESRFQVYGKIMTKMALFFSVNDRITRM